MAYPLEYGEDIDECLAKTVSVVQPVLNIVNLNARIVTRRINNDT